MVFYPAGWVVVTGDTGLKKQVTKDQTSVPEKLCNFNFYNNYYIFIRL